MILGELAAMASAALWAFSSSAMAGLTRRMPAVAVSAMRLWCGVLFYATLLLVTGKVNALLHVGTGRALALAATASVAMAFGDTIFIYGMQLIGVGRASPISVTTYPLLTLLLAWALLGEAISLQTALGGLLVLGGIVLILVRPRAPLEAGVALGPVPMAPAIDGDGAVAVAVAAPPAALPEAQMPLAKGLALVLIAALAWAVSTIWLRTLTENTDLIVVNTVRVPTAAFLLSGAAMSRGLLRPRRVQRRDLALLAGAGFIGSGLGSLLYVYALREAGAGLSALLNSLSPVFALPLAAVFLGERITGRMVAGTVVALAGVALVLG